jgi:stringent starvation protein B
MARSDTQHTQQRPYFIRAMHEWMVDNGLTPHVVVDASHDGLTIPREYVENGKLVLNLSLTATRNLVIGNEYAELEARFGGVPRQLVIPMGAIIGIYARETGQGMVFTDDASASETSGEDSPSSPPDGDGPGRGKRPSLKVVR